MRIKVESVFRIDERTWALSGWSASSGMERGPAVMWMPDGTSHPVEVTRIEWRDDEGEFTVTGVHVRSLARPEPGCVVEQS